MVAAAAAALLALTFGPGPRPAAAGELLAIEPGEEASEARSLVVDTGIVPRLPAAPAAVLTGGERPPQLPARFLEADGRPLSLDVEGWQGTICLKGAWTLRAFDDPRTPARDAVLRDFQLSPAVLAEGGRYLPGIAASTHF
jgi:hypothetical protein